MSKSQKVSQSRRCCRLWKTFSRAHCNIFKVQALRKRDCISFPSLSVNTAPHTCSLPHPLHPPTSPPAPRPSVCFPCGLIPFCPSTPIFFFPPDLKCLTRLPSSRSTLSPSSDSHPADFPQVMLHSIGFFHFKYIIWLFFIFSIISCCLRANRKSRCGRLSRLWPVIKSWARRLSCKFNSLVQRV